MTGRHSVTKQCRYLNRNRHKRWKFYVARLPESVSFQEKLKCSKTELLDLMGKNDKGKKKRDLVKQSDSSSKNKIIAL